MGQKALFLYVNLSLHCLFTALKLKSRPKFAIALVLTLRVWATRAKLHVWVSSLGHMLASTQAATEISMPNQECLPVTIVNPLK